MSALTSCNRCNLNRMTREAAKRGAVVLLTHHTEGEEMAGWISARYSDQDEPSAWFMELTESCVC